MGTFDMLIVSPGEAAVVITQFFEWFSKFKSSMTSAEDADGSGKPIDKQNRQKCEWLKELSLEHSRVTYHEVANTLRI